MDNSLWNYPWFDSYEFVLTPPVIQQAGAVQSQQPLVILSPAGWIRAAPPDDPSSGRRVAAAAQIAAHDRHDQRRMVQVVRRLFETLVGGDIFVKTELVCNRQGAAFPPSGRASIRRPRCGGGFTASARGGEPDFFGFSGGRGRRVKTVFDRQLSAARQAADQPGQPPPAPGGGDTAEREGVLDFRAECALDH